ncbi:MAG: glycerol-3-phosphate 1-O-acyltransferase PlsY [Phycisphaerales bacterium]
MLWALLIPAAFLCGSIPFALIIGRARGIDIRTFGSGNIGATNVGRALGWKYGLLCFALDVLKGFIPTFAAGLLAGVIRPSLACPPIDPHDAWPWVGVLAAAVLGHIFSPWVGFRGGKGVATGLGAMLGVYPYLTFPAVLCFLVWYLVVKLSRYVSLASVVAAAALPLLVYAWTLVPGGGGRGPGPVDLAPFYAVSAVLALLVIWRHRSNIRRLLDGTENPVGTRRPARP